MKLKNLTIENFRSFEHFTLNKLGRVNLLVGTNNSGKTTILEAIYVFMSSKKLSSIWSLLYRRGEVFPTQNSSSATVPTDRNADLHHLFKNRTLRNEDYFSLRGDTDKGYFETRAVIKFSMTDTISPDEFTTAGLFLNGNPQTTSSKISLSLSTKSDPAIGQTFETIEVQLNGDGGLDLNSQKRQATISSSRQYHFSPNFVSVGSMTNQVISRLYNQIVLTSEEDLVLEAVRLLSPEIERIAAVGGGADWPDIPTNDGIFIRLAGIRNRIPIGSMGDGIWRMLGLALAVVHSQDGILLIDEVDTGLHYSVMEKMWRFLNECSLKFNVQIFATTHSLDCYQSLAAICREDVVDRSEVTIQRIDRKRSEAVAYSEAAIIAAAENVVEVR